MNPRKQRCRFCRTEIVGWRPGDPTFCGGCFIEYQDRVAKRNAAAGPVPSLLPAPDIEFEAFRERLIAKRLSGEKLTLEEREQIADLATLRAMGGRRPGTVMRSAEQIRTPDGRRARPEVASEKRDRKPRPSDYGIN